MSLILFSYTEFIWLLVIFPNEKLPVSWPSYEFVYKKITTSNNLFVSLKKLQLFVFQVVKFDIIRVGAD